MRKAVKRIGKVIVPKNLYSKLVALRSDLKSTRQDISYIKKRVEEHDNRLTKLQDIYQKADPYQPIYGLEGIGSPQRDSRDRCEAIFEFFDNNVQALRVLDVGCFFGYLSFYLQDRGARVEGWDNNDVNIEVARRTQDITGINADFKVKEFNKETIAAIQPGQYDVVFILSVLHWTIALQGIEYVQDCLKLLMDRVPMVVVELAQKGEDKKLFWDKVVPKNDLDIFDKVKGLKVHKIGEFPTHLSDKKRPIYAITKDHVAVNGHHYQVDELILRAYHNAPQWRPISSRYFAGDKVFIKEYHYDDNIEETRRYLVNEINFFLQNASIHNKNIIEGVPKLIDFEIGSRSTKLVMERVDGELLSFVAKHLTLMQKEKIAIGILRIMEQFEAQGLHHNDLRSWNVMVSKDNKAYLIDMELVSPKQYENNIISYMWVMNSLLTGKEEERTRNKIKLPPPDAFSTSSVFSELYKLTTAHNSIPFSKLLASIDTIKSKKPASK